MTWQACWASYGFHLAIAASDGKQLMDTKENHGHVPLWDVQWLWEEQISSKLCTAGEKQGKDSIQGPKAHALPVGGWSTAPRSAPLGHLSLPPQQMENFPECWLARGQEHCFVKLAAEKVHCCLFFVPSLPSLVQKLRCILTQVMVGLISADANSVVGRNKKQMAQILTQTSVSCTSAMTLHMCFPMSVALHKETVRLRINLGTKTEKACTFIFLFLPLTPWI